MKKIAKLLLILFAITSGISCTETSTLEKRIAYLSDEDMQAVRIISNRFNTLLKHRTTLSFMKSYAEQPDKKSFMVNYLTPHFNGDEMNLAIKVIELLTMSHGNENLKTENIPLEISPAVSLLSQELTNQLTSTISIASDQNQSPDQLKISLQGVLANFKSTIQANTSLTFDEAQALLTFAEFEESSIGETIDFVYAEEATYGARTKGWFRKLIQVVVTAVVAVVVVVAAVATGGVIAGVVGATWFGTAVAVGAIAGGVYGIAVGYDMAVNHNSYFTDFNPFNIAGGFLDWEHCSGNPGHWACI